MAIDCKQFVSSISGVDSSSFANETERAEAKAAAEKLLAKLETPWETTMKTVWLQVILAGTEALSIKSTLADPGLSLLLRRA